MLSTTRWLQMLDAWKRGNKAVGAPEVVPHQVGTAEHDRAIGILEGECSLFSFDVLVSTSSLTFCRPIIVTR